MTASERLAQALGQREDESDLTEGKRARVEREGDRSVEEPTSRGGRKRPIGVELDEEPQAKYRALPDEEPAPESPGMPSHLPTSQAASSSSSSASKLLPLVDFVSPATGAVSMAGAVRGK